MTSPASPAATEAVNQLHWATQLLSASCDALLAREPDDSQSSLAWDDEVDGFVTRALPAGIRLALLPPSAEIAISHADSLAHASRRIVLHRITLDDLKAALASEIPAFQSDATRIAFRDYDMPDHPVALGAPFSFEDPTILRSLAANWRTAHLVLESAAANLDAGDRTPTLLWPHHFDLGNLVLLDAGADPATDPSVGLGYVAGDAQIHEPYFYANPYVPNRPENLPALTLGEWTSAWFGAVLTRSNLLKVAPDGLSSTAGRDAVHRFLTHVIDLAQTWR